MPTTPMPSPAPVADLGDNGDLFLSGDSIFTILMLVTLAGVTIAVGLLFWRLRRLLLLAAALIFLIVWLPTQCGTGDQHYHRQPTSNTTKTETTP